MCLLGSAGIVVQDDDDAQANPQYSSANAGSHQSNAYVNESTMKVAAGAGSQRDSSARRTGQKSKSSAHNYQNTDPVDTSAELTASKFLTHIAVTYTHPPLMFICDAQEVYTTIIHVLVLEDKYCCSANQPALSHLLKTCFFCNH